MVLAYSTSMEISYGTVKWYHEENITHLRPDRGETASTLLFRRCRPGFLSPSGFHRGMVLCYITVRNNSYSNSMHPAYKSPTPIPTAYDKAALIEDEITELYAHVNAATYRLLELIRALDKEEPWGAWGLNSCAHWLNWKCGVGPVAAREKVRVARALKGLPQISECFRKGEVSYSKVRAMTRVATPSNEDYLLEIAEYGTAAHVDAEILGSSLRITHLLGQSSEFRVAAIHIRF